jgi:hypothetical protein
VSLTPASPRSAYLGRQATEGGCCVVENVSLVRRADHAEEFRLHFQRLVLESLQRSAEADPACSNGEVRLRASLRLLGGLWLADMVLLVASLASRGIHSTPSAASEATLLALSLALFLLWLRASDPDGPESTGVESREGDELEADPGQVSVGVRISAYISTTANDEQDRRSRGLDRRSSRLQGG